MQADHINIQNRSNNQHLSVSIHQGQLLSSKSMTSTFEGLINKTEREVQRGEVSGVFDNVDDFINDIKSSV